ncbi:hypothetical protein QQX98_003254 [Neonectria punicea]|uniref:RRM domain-containing protein n=1 Tax=Neonectria punicea TaxID=979145 RepID=A0ABR1HEE5_9HYPO
MEHETRKAYDLPAKPSEHMAGMQQDKQSPTQAPSMPPLQYPMAAHPMPQCKRNITVQDHMRAQSMHPHLAVTYPAHSSGLIVHPTYGQHAAGYQNNAFNMEHHQQMNSVPVRRQSHHIGGMPSISAASQIDRKDNKEPHWSANNQPRNDNFNNGLPTPNRGAGQRNGPRNMKGNRRGSQSQRSATVHVPQHHGNQVTGQNRRDGTPWNSTWRRPSIGSQSNVCRNPKTSNGSVQYVHCVCEECNNRNCSAYVSVKGSTANQQVLDIQARIKSGLGDRFGLVIDVFPVASRDFTNFIVRFAHENSVSEALTFGGGDMPDRGISVTISPVMRSKWTARSREGVIPGDRQRGHQSGYSFPNLGSPPAMNQPLPLAHPNSGGVSQLAHLAQPHAGFSNIQMHNPQLAAGGFPNQNYLPAGTQFAQTGFIRPGLPTMPYAMQHHLANSEKVQQQGQRSNSLHHESLSGHRAVLPKKVEIPTKETQKPTPSAAGPENTKKQDSDTTRGKGGKSNGAKHRGALPKTAKPEGASKSSDNVESSQATQDVTDVGECDTHPPTTAVNSCERPVLTLDTTVTASSPGKDQRATHNRVPSVFTDNEIKERRKAWARISMPLIPCKPKGVSTKAAEIVGDAQQFPKERKVGNSTTGSERSSPSHPCLTPDTDSIRGLSLKKSSEASTSGEACNEQSIQTNPAPRPETPLHSEATQKPAASGQLSGEMATKTAIKPFKGPGGTQNKNKQVASGRESRQSDRSGHGSSTLSTPTVSNISLPANKPSESRLASQGSNGTNKAGEAPRKNKNKNKNRKKLKQGDGSRPESPVTSVAAGTQDHSKEKSPHLQKNTINEGQSSANPISTEDSSEVMGTQVPRPRSASPSKRPREESFQKFCSIASKRNKQDGDQIQSTQPDQPSTLKHPVETQVAVPETNSRVGYRANAGGSLRMRKNRKNRALVTEPSVAEQRLDTQVAPPSSDFAFECSNEGRPKAINIVFGGADSGKLASPITKSRLNPEAEDFQSPSRVTNAGTNEKVGENMASNKVGLVTPPGPQKTSGGSKMTSPKETTPTEDKKGQAPNGGTGAESPTPTATKKPSKSQKRDKAKEKAAPIQDEDQAPKTPSKASPVKKELDNDDWPSLPPPRERATSKSSARSLSLWTKKTGSEQSSPAHK